LNRLCFSISTPAGVDFFRAKNALWQSCFIFGKIAEFEIYFSKDKRIFGKIK